MKKLFTAILFLFLFSVGYAQVPAAISYQGIIIDPTTGETAPNGQHTIKFTFYDAPLSGNFKWETSDIAVTTFKGLFTTIIPVPENTNWTAPSYVQLTVDDAVLTTRIPLTAVPFAYRANSADKAITMDASGLSGTISDERLTSHLRDLADGTLSGSKVGAGVNAEMIDNGILPNAILDSDLQDLALDGILSASKVQDLDATKIATGILDPSRIPGLDASKIESGILSTDRIPDLNASKIVAGTISDNVLPATLAKGSGQAGRIPVWVDANQIGSSDLYWDPTEHELGVNTITPGASLHIVHDDSHPEGPSMIIENNSEQAQITPKTGLEMDLLTNPPTGNITGINLEIGSDGTGLKRGVEIHVTSGNSSNYTAYGVTATVNGFGTSIHTALDGNSSATSGTNIGVDGSASGSGNGPKYGVMGTAAGSGTKYGVWGSSSGSGTDHYGVYGTAMSGTNNYGVYGTVTGGANHYAIYGKSTNASGFAVFAEGNLKVTGNINYTGILTDDVPSDRQLKKDIRPMGTSLSSIMNLKPYNYYFRTKEFSRLALPEKKQYGLIAQEVAEIFPELVREKTMDEIRDEQGNITEAALTYKALDYTSLIPVLIKGMQEQQAIIEELKAEVKKLKSLTPEKKSEPRLVKASLKN